MLIIMFEIFGKCLILLFRETEVIAEIVPKIVPKVHPKSEMSIEMHPRSGKATVCTGQIDHITEKGIRMEGGEHVDADFIISATGFTLQQNYPFSTIKASVDGEDYKVTILVGKKNLLLT